MSKRREPRTNRVTVIMSDELNARVDVEAEEQHRSKSDFIRLVLIEWFEAVDEQRRREVAGVQEED